VDITSDIHYRGLLLTGAAQVGEGGAATISGLRITRATYSNVSVHGYTEKKSLDDGMDASDVFLGVRQVILQGEAYASTKGKLFDILDDLRLTFTPTDAFNEAPRFRGYLPLYFEQPTAHLIHWPEGVIPRELRCRPSAQPEHDIQFSAISGDADSGFVVPFVLRLEAKDPRFYGVDDLDYLFVGDGVVGAHLPRNRGNYPAPVNLVLASDVTSTTKFTLVGVNTNLEVTIPSGTGTRTVVVDSYDKVVTLTAGSTETLRMDLIKFNSGSTWPRAMPNPEGQPDSLFDWSYTTGEELVAGSRMSFRETWA
jgi:hypothetical protein